MLWSSAFEHEKRINLDLVEHLQAMERNLVGMGKEVERLRAEVLNAEKRLQSNPLASTILFWVFFFETCHIF